MVVTPENTPAEASPRPANAHALPEWQLQDRARTAARQQLEERGIYGSTTQAIQQEADELLAQWAAAPAADVDGAAR